MDEIKVSVVKFPDRTNLVLKFIDPATGRQKYRSAKTIIRRDAERAAAQWENELREGIADCRKVTWAQFRERYELEVLASLADGTDQKVQGIFNAVEKQPAKKVHGAKCHPMANLMRSCLRSQAHSDHLFFR